MPKSTLCLAVILGSCIVLNSARVVYFNIFTHSLPFGIYMRVNGIPYRGEYAASCLTPEIAAYGIERHYLAQGDCATGTVRVLKIIQGVPGDSFYVKNGFLGINGHLYGIMGRDSLGRRLRLFYGVKRSVLGQGQYLLLSDFVPNSWDSRYWGPVRVEFLLKPLWIFD